MPDRLERYQEAVQLSLGESGPPTCPECGSTKGSLGQAGAYFMCQGSCAGDGGEARNVYWTPDNRPAAEWTESLKASPWGRRADLVQILEDQIKIHQALADGAASKWAIELEKRQKAEDEIDRLKEAGRALTPWLVGAPPDLSPVVCDRQTWCIRGDGHAGTCWRKIDGPIPEGAAPDGPSEQEAMERAAKVCDGPFTGKEGLDSFTCAYLGRAIRDLAPSGDQKCKKCDGTGSIETCGPAPDEERGYPCPDCTKEDPCHWCRDGDHKWCIDLCGCPCPSNSYGATTDDLRRVVVMTEILRAVAALAEQKVREHGEFNSIHEAAAVIKEEYDELWDIVRQKRADRSPAQVRHECVDLAAAAVKCALTFGTVRPLSDLTDSVDIELKEGETLEDALGAVARVSGVPGNPDAEPDHVDAKVCEQNQWCIREEGHPKGCWPNVDPSHLGDSPSVEAVAENYLDGLHAGAKPEIDSLLKLLAPDLQAEGRQRMELVRVLYDAGRHPSTTSLGICSVCGRPLDARHGEGCMVAPLDPGKDPSELFGLADKEPERLGETLVPQKPIYCSTVCRSWHQPPECPKGGGPDGGA